MALRDVYDGPGESVSIEVAPERKLDSKELRRALVEHDLFRPNEPDDEDHVHSLTVADIRNIAAIKYPDIDFDQISTEQIGVVVNAIQSHSITPEEQALGSFTRRKLKKLSTWKEWLAAKHKQLNHFHMLGMYGWPIED